MAGRAANQPACYGQYTPATSRTPRRIADLRGSAWCGSWQPLNVYHASTVFPVREIGVSTNAGAHLHPPGSRLDHSMMPGRLAPGRLTGPPTQGAGRGADPTGKIVLELRR